MKLTSIKIKSFLGIDNLDLAIERPILLCAGPNASGKTSVAHGLRFVLTGDLCRIQHKKNIKALVRDGAKLGHVTVGIAAGYETGGRTDHPWTPTEHTRSAATGNYTSANPPPAPHPALAYLLDPPAFLALAPNDRRQFLFDLAGVSMKPDAVMAKLGSRGHPKAIVTRMAEELRQGFQVAHIEAKALARDGRTRWHAATFEDYGSVKAETWEARAPADIPDLEALKPAHDTCSQEIGMVQAQIGAFNERAAERKRAQERTAGLKSMAGNLAENESRFNSAEEDFNKLHADEHTASQEFSEADKEAAVEVQMGMGTFFSCPECGVSLVLSRGVAKKAAPVTKEDNNRLINAQTRVTILREQLATLGNRVSAANMKMHNAAEAVGHSKHAVETLAKLEEGGFSYHDGEEESPQDLSAKLKELTARRDELTKEIALASAAAAMRSEAHGKTAKALLIHKEIQNFVALADDLAPDGLPAELLAQALGPINQRLADSAAMTGWSRVTLDTEGITLGPRPLALASASEQWRAGAMIAEAIAMLSGLKLFALDGMDILDAPSRAQALAWLTAIAPEHESIIVMATLKAPPSGLPDTVQLCWLGPPPAMTKAEGQAFDEARMQAAGEFAEEMAGQ